MSAAAGLFFLILAVWPMQRGMKWLFRGQDGDGWFVVGYMIASMLLIATGIDLLAGGLSHAD